VASSNEIADQLAEVSDRLRELEHAAELIKTVLIVKEPNTVRASEAYDGLRKQVIASASERRAHVVQLVTMAVAVRRATTVEDLHPQLAEWLQQSNVQTVWQVPPGERPANLFDIEEEVGERAMEVLEPAYIDLQTGTLVRLGRAVSGTVAAAPPKTEVVPGGNGQ
jgi:hypothetical protein